MLRKLVIGKTVPKVAYYMYISFFLSHLWRDYEEGFNEYFHYQQQSKILLLKLEYYEDTLKFIHLVRPPLYLLQLLGRVWAEDGGEKGGADVGEI